MIAETMNKSDTATLEPETSEPQTRQEFVRKLKDKIDQWNQDLDQWERKAKETSKEIGSDLKQRRQNSAQAFREKRNKIERKIQELQSSSDDAWDDMKEGIEKSWNDLRESFQKVRNNFN